MECNFDIHTGKTVRSKNWIPYPAAWQTPNHQPVASLVLKEIVTLGDFLRTFFPFPESTKVAFYVFIFVYRPCTCNNFNKHTQSLSTPLFYKFRCWLLLLVTKQSKFRFGGQTIAWSSSQYGEAAHHKWRGNHL
jgi:hypothetical protein